MAKDLRVVIEELKQDIVKLGGTLNYDRQHGKAGIMKEDEQAELVRIRNNLASQLSRLKRKQNQKETNQKARLYQTTDVEEDENGISKVDERRYKNCFVLENVNPEVEYVQRMTGLNYEQIKILENKLHLYVNRSRVL